MSKRSHDLSGNEAKFSLSLLIETAQIAVGLAKVKCERALEEVQRASFKNDVCALVNAAQDVAEAGQALKQATNTLHYLNESKTREKVTVIFDV